MYPTLSDALLNLQAEVEALLAGRLPVPDLPDARASFFEALGERGWNVPLWPRRWGGGGLTAEEAFVIDRTLTRAGAPVLDRQTIDLVGPLLMSFADEMTCRRWLPGIASGAVRACCHSSVHGGPPLSGEFDSGIFRPHDPMLRVYDARDAGILIAIAEKNASAALVMAPLEPADVTPGLPLDADVVHTEGLAFEVVATATAAAELTGRGESVEPAGTLTGRSWTGRLRYLLELMTAEDPAADTAALEVSLRGLEILELRALSAGQDVQRALDRVLAIRGSELGRALVERYLAALGYYALAAPDVPRQHNELPRAALVARDAVAELIRYLLADTAGYRDELARFLNRASPAGADGGVRRGTGPAHGGEPTQRP